MKSEEGTNYHQQPDSQQGKRFMLKSSTLKSHGGPKQEFKKPESLEKFAIPEFAKPSASIGIKHEHGVCSKPLFKMSTFTSPSKIR